MSFDIDEALLGGKLMLALGELCILVCWSLRRCACCLGFSAPIVPFLRWTSTAAIKFCLDT